MGNPEWRMEVKEIFEKMQRKAKEQMEADWLKAGGNKLREMEAQVGKVVEDLEIEKVARLEAEKSNRQMNQELEDLKKMNMKELDELVQKLEEVSAANQKLEESMKKLAAELKDATLELDTHRSKVLELEGKQKNWLERKMDKVFGRNPSSKTSTSVVKESKGANDINENLEGIVDRMSCVQIGKDNSTEDQEGKEEGGDLVKVGKVKAMEDME